MPSLNSVVDVAIVGAGAAGIAAARRLRAAGVSTLLIEARPRLGGRAHTIAAGADVIDLGCEWLHSADRNPLVQIARENGFTVDEGTPNWGRHAGRGFSDSEQREFRAASERFWEALEQAAQGGAPDAPASGWLPPDNRWNPLIQAISTYYNGVELEQVSITDLGRYEDTGVNWTVRQGLGALIEGLGAGLPVALNCTVSAIDHSGPRIVLRTTRGAIEAGAVIVTLPSALISGEHIQFTPELPDKVEAATHLPLGLADKIFFEIAHPADLPVDGHLWGATDRKEAISFDIFPRGRPYVAGFVGGAFARALEREGEAAMEAEARRQLSDMMGAEILSHLRFIGATAWDLDPLARGAYSHALPGHADAHGKLAASVDGRLFFAGEACSINRFSTVHGAWETGVAAADEYLKAR